ncbi:MAG: SH3 domain-containing protein [Chloracidobacterium sp.]|nr:SH3 domain-containing protein [Chloracidobacterium sp.]
MSQDASAGQSKRYVYGPMVYQLPGEEEKSGSGKQAWNFPAGALIALLVGVAILLSFRERAAEVGRFNPRSSFGEERIFRDANEDYRISASKTYARVAVDRLCLREGPGTIYAATYLLPKRWRVSLIGDYRTDNYGEVWTKVLVRTEDGPQEGWVSRRYLID